MNKDMTTLEMLQKTINIQQGKEKPKPEGKESDTVDKLKEMFGMK